VQQLLAGPRAQLDRALLTDALSLRHGATVRHGVDVFDLAGRPTFERLPWTSGTVTWAYREPSETGGQELTRTGIRRRFDVTLSGRVDGINLSARRLRPWTGLRLRDGAWAVFRHGMFEPENPGLADDGVHVRRDVQAVDKAGRWSAKTLGRPIVVPGTVPIVAYVQASLTAVFGEVDFAIAASPLTLGRQRVFEADDSYLDFYSELLQGIGHDQLTADEEGRPASQPVSVLAGQGAEATYGARQGKILTAASVDPLFPTLPNVLIFSARQGPSLGNEIGNGLAVRRNERTGPASIEARGGGVAAEVEQTIPVDVDNQSALEAVADAEQQRYFAGGGLRFRGRIGLNPLAGERDVFAVRLPRLGLVSGLWVCTEWSLHMTSLTDHAAALMDVTAERRVA